MILLFKVELWLSLSLARPANTLLMTTALTILWRSASSGTLTQVLCKKKHSCLKIATMPSRHYGGKAATGGTTSAGEIR
jgi:hypothetical protein